MHLPDSSLENIKINPFICNSTNNKHQITQGIVLQMKENKPFASN